MTTELPDTHPTQDAGNLLILAVPAGVGAFTCSAARIEDGIARGYRLTRDAHGVLTLQGAYQWSQGFLGGIEWRDIPTVQL